MANKTGPTCADHREEMILLGLRMQLNQEDLPEEKRQAILEEIKKLESQMGMK